MTRERFVDLERFAILWSLILDRCFAGINNR
jgi:hypothetical protein